MKVSELIALLQSRHPDAEVNIFFSPNNGPMNTNLADHEYCLFEIPDVGDWGNPGGSDDLVTINGGALVGC